uniref:ATP synthase F1 subunit epsilon n=2 Tax=Dermatophagoides pteronyssinus TaxID=6956 RepID=A0A6P6Y7T2_DERPT|nr:ATPase inhibitor mai-1, mitochondrial-like [Dermatophagoides pteronyssinus]
MACTHCFCFRSKNFYQRTNKHSIFSVNSHFLLEKSQSESIMNRVFGNRATLSNLMVNINKASSRNMSGEWGSGSGKGGGTGGSVRDAGGAFGRMEAAREEEFFRRKQQEELEKLRKALDSQRQELEKQIKEHESEIERLRKIQKEGQ